MTSLENNHYYYGFDYLRALMITAIIIWHTELLGGLDLCGISQYRNLGVDLPAIICSQFLLLAVPTFFLISFFLFVGNVNSRSGYVPKRLERLLYLYLFWAGLFILARYRCDCSTLTNQLSQGPGQILSFFAGEGISVYYFNFSLLVLTGLCFFFVKAPRIIIWILLFFSLILFCIGPAQIISHSPPLSYSYYEPSLIVYWNPVNFLPYIFIALLVRNYEHFFQFNNNSAKYKFVLISLFFFYILTSIVEWLWIQQISEQPHGGYIPPYMRISVVFGVSLFFLLFLSVEKKPGKLISYLSDHSLGIYCLHPFIIGTFIGLLGRPRYNLPYTVLILALSAVLSHFVRRAFKFRLI